MRILASVVVCFITLSSSLSYSQFYVSPQVGFKSSGLKGVIKLTQPNSVNTGNVAEASKTGFVLGTGVGYTLLSGGIYTLDMNVDITYASIAYFEEGYNKGIGSGAFAANGLSGGSTTVLSFELLPLHKISIPSFSLLTPFAGVGLGFNYMSTGDIKVTPPSGNGTLTGNSEFKVGLVLTYGAYLNLTSRIEPFVQFKHMIPFGSETVFTQDYQPTSGSSSKAEYSIADAPGYFSLTAGCRFNF